MSELINNSEKRKEMLKHMILELHSGQAPEQVKKRLAELLKNIPYDEVVEVEQELISEGLPVEEVLKLCDVHTQVLDGHIDQSAAKPVPAGHPVDLFKQENRELEKVTDDLKKMFQESSGIKSEEMEKWLIGAHRHFNSLMDVDKHYLRKEYLLFPFLESHGITGPPKVMWGKHDETRELLKTAIDAVSSHAGISPDELPLLIDGVLQPAAQSVLDMIMKEEEILLPMSMDTLTDEEWYQVHQQTPEYGFCLVDPDVDWKPEGVNISEVEYGVDNSVRLPTGAFNIDELAALFTTLPIDLTYVDKDDKVKFFSHGPNRIFARNRAILGRDVRMCHPPGSVHIVDQIVEDFKSGKESSAAFWINFQERFIYIEYFAVRGKDGEYLGVVEFTQDLTKLRKLEGEQRLLNYSKE
ncbi:DUF438 domain-containing protein [Natronoflexus pectinivorans]|uniref:Hemerythrin-like domain-containing protein n=1 Tax=Natronoflexus pectinivorans TaxID=682526 RepID=A0A4R2GLB2_9BACT|nr:DUF438 domain-containing protein [Natronoflexus pectinivorans]TCO09703.1 hypothetical protein EV194_102129 [Natronoflexus pectinivorans]